MAAAALTRAGGLLTLERTSKAMSNRAFLGNMSSLRAVAVPPKKSRVSSIRASAEKYQVIEPLNGDPFIGGFETSVTSSPLVAWYLSNLPAYRTAVAPLFRGVEIGLAHGYFLVGPFVLTGPLRNSSVRGEAGSLAAAGLVTILTICLTIYGIASFKEGEASKAPSLTLTGRQKSADKLQTAEGWASFTGGWFFGGLSGVAWAYTLLYVLNLPYPVK
ncbi:hypothetical protein M758_UG321600 [Ceratodon purpureus]|nr:hypothetical protein M758_UG321600 [Ceratodon purpureus]